MKELVFLKLKPKAHDLISAVNNQYYMMSSLVKKLQWIALSFKLDIQSKSLRTVSNNSEAISSLKWHSSLRHSFQIRPFFSSVWALKVILCINVYKYIYLHITQIFILFPLEVYSACSVSYWLWIQIYATLDFLAICLPYTIYSGVFTHFF